MDEDSSMCYNKDGECSTGCGSDKVPDLISLYTFININNNNYYYCCSFCYYY
jgi:hypothetical protein